MKLNTFSGLALLFSLISCSNSDPSMETLRVSNQQVTDRYFNEIYGEDRLDLIDSLFTENYSHIGTEGQLIEHAAPRLKEAITFLKTTFPNLKPEITAVVPDTNKVMYLITFHADLPEMASPNTKAEDISFTETFVFWVKDGKIRKGQTAGAHLPLIKQVSGFEGSVFDIIEILTSHGK